MVIRDCLRIIKVLVVPSVTHSFIFGSDFAKKISLVLNFKNDTWDIQKSNVQLSTVSKKSVFVSQFPKLV